MVSEFAWKQGGLCVNGTENPLELFTFIEMGQMTIMTVTLALCQEED